MKKLTTICTLTLLMLVTSIAVAEPKYKVFDTSTDIGTAASNASVLHGVYINTTLSAHTVVIKNGTAAVFTIPASAAAGTYYDFEGTEFTTNIIVDPDDSSTGSITLLYEGLSRPE